MDAEGHLHAVLAKAAYDYYHLESPEKAQEELEAYGLKDYTIIPEFSDDHAVTIIQPDGTAVIAYRGTHLTSGYDLMADALIASNYHGNPKYRYAVNYLTNAIGVETRFERALNHYLKVKENHEVAALTGHSLGGELASFVGRESGSKVVMLNKGSSPFADPFFAAPSLFENQRHYTTGSDPISFAATLTPGLKTIYVPASRSTHDFLTHSLNYFLPKRVSKQPEPKYLHSIRIADGTTMRFCELYPDHPLC